MINLTFFDIGLIIHEFLYLIILNIWSFIFKNDYLKSPNPLFAYIISTFNSFIIISYMFFIGVSYIYMILYIIYFIDKIFSIVRLIFDYEATIDYISIFTTIIIILIIIFISIISSFYIY